MSKILILYHSQTGSTEKMAYAVTDGAKIIENTEVDNINNPNVEVETCQRMSMSAKPAKKSFH